MEILAGILPAVASLTAMGAVFGGILGFAARLFAVETDERIPRIIDVLPGANCGGCGFAGCGAFAAAVVEGVTPTNNCVVGGARTAARVAAIMGTTALTVQHRVAAVKCSGSCDRVQMKYDYTGYADCHAVNSLSGGAKMCAFACTGMGSCTRACPFGAIAMVDGLAVVDREVCTGCGVCVKACPKGIIEMRPYDCEYEVLCSNTEMGIAVRDICKVGCVTCGLCVRTCHSGAITIKNNLAHIDPEVCINCHACVDQCPRKVIADLSKQVSGRSGRQMDNAAS